MDTIERKQNHQTAADHARPGSEPIVYLCQGSLLPYFDPGIARSCRAYDFCALAPACHAELCRAAMPSLRAILSSHAPILLVDAASARIQAGVWSATGSIRWESSDNEASLGVFACVEQLGIKIDSVGGFVFCDGPGSILGIRTVAMALRTWRVLTPRPIWAYRSLDLLVHALGDPAIAAIADARRDRWHVARLGHPMMRVPTAELPRTPLVAPGGFRQWSKLPGGLAVHSAPYDLATLWPRALDADLLHPIDEPEAFLHEEPIYAEWTPQIHRASS